MLDHKSKMLRKIANVMEVVKIVIWNLVGFASLLRKIPTSEIMPITHTVASGYCITISLNILDNIFLSIPIKILFKIGIVKQNK